VLHSRQGLSQLHGGGKLRVQDWQRVAKKRNGPINSFGAASKLGKPSTGTVAVSFHANLLLIG